MKLKSKLIATIVSMCAAIAVMGVGVWASTSQNFIVTVNNDIDVKIINVDADVYGEFAVYTQFIGQVEANKTPALACKYGTTALGDGYTDHTGYDRGYLLYAKGVGVNDGTTGNFDNSMTDYSHVERGHAYQNYINDAKDYVFLATSNATLVNNNSGSTIRTDAGEGNADYSTIYNVDSTTHTAQVAYMYTIKQWAMASANAASNALYLDLSVNLSSDLVNRLEGVQNTIGNADAQIRINSYIVNTDEASKPWREVNFTDTDTDGIYTSRTFLPQYVDASTQDTAKDYQTYYLIITYTFGRNNANLDLSRLTDALNHTLTLSEASAEEVQTSDNANSYTKLNQVYVGNATGGNAVLGSEVQGTAWTPTWADGTSVVRRLSTDANLDDILESHLPDSYIFTMKDGSTNTISDSFKWLKSLQEGAKATGDKDGIA